MHDSWIKNTLYENGTLKNKLGIHDASKLQNLEYRIVGNVSLRLLQRRMRVTSIEDLIKIHQLMFQDLYEWAGKERPGDFKKGDNVFFPHESFSYARQNINQLIQSYPQSDPLSAKDYATLLDRINYYHPFREGNGRSTRTFLQLFAAQHHQVIEYPRHNKEMIEAEENADVNKISRLIKIENMPSREAAFQQLLLNHQHKDMKEKARRAILRKRRGLDR